MINTFLVNYLQSVDSQSIGSKSVLKCVKAMLNGFNIAFYENVKYYGLIFVFL